MEASQKLEGKLEFSVLILLGFFLALTVVAIKKFGIDLPTCITNVAPFSKGAVLERAPNHFEIHYVAKMWVFEPAIIELPTGSEADIYLNSVDVNHGFQIAGTNVNLMAVPGAINYSHVKFTTPGKYLVICHEYCGTGHHGMIASILVSDHPNHLGETQEVAAAPSSEMTEDAKAGSQLIATKGCTACHSLDPSQTGVGPSFKGLWGKTEELIDGSQVLVDEGYITESIQQPQAKIVKGYQPIMPVLPMNHEEIEQVITFLKTVK